MEENEVSIPFDLKHIRDNTLKRKRFVDYLYYVNQL